MCALRFTVPGDRDLDAVLLLPLDESLDNVRDAIAARIDAIGRPFELQVNDDGKSRWLVFLSPSDDPAYPHIERLIRSRSARSRHARSDGGGEPGGGCDVAAVGAALVAARAPSGLKPRGDGAGMSLMKHTRPSASTWRGCGGGGRRERQDGR